MQDIEYKLIGYNPDSGSFIKEADFNDQRYKVGYFLVWIDKNSEATLRQASKDELQMIVRIKRVEIPFNKLDPSHQLQDMELKFKTLTTTPVGTSSVCSTENSKISHKDFFCGKALTYISSSFDKLETVSIAHCYVLPVKHFSLFATRDIKEGTIIGEYMRENIGSIKRLEKSNSNRDKTYWMECKGKIIDATKKGNFTRFINEPPFEETANVIYIKSDDGNKTLVKTTKDIKAGQQLLVCYNPGTDPIQHTSKEQEEQFKFLSCNDLPIDPKSLFAKNEDNYLKTKLNKKYAKSFFEALGIDGVYEIAITQLIGFIIRQDLENIKKQLVWEKN